MLQDETLEAGGPPMTPATHTPRQLVTGATGKVGQAFLARFVEEPRYAGFDIRALCHNRTLEDERIETVDGSIADRDVAGPPCGTWPTSSTSPR
jgi:nucleoside-diphosphate-sugar epimerase